MTDPSPLTDERPPKPRPAPIPDQDSAEYWTALHDGRLLIQRCTDCGGAQLYPRDRCLACRGPVAFEEASGRGNIYSFTVIRQNYARPFRNWIPYVVALVEIVEQPELRLTTNLVGCALEEIRIGMAVRVVFRQIEDSRGDVWLPLFEPDRDPQ